MSTSSPGTPKPSAAVYRRRRLVALLGLVVVIALVWWLVSAVVGALTGGSAPEPGPSSTQAVAPAPPPASPEPSTPAPEPSTPAPSAPETPAEPEPCTANEVTVTARTDAESYGPDQQPQLSFALANGSDRPCVMDVGTASQEFSITSGSDLIWLSSHCMSEPAQQLVRLEPGQSVDSPPLGWVRERSTPDTCAGERPAAVAGGAYYNLTVTVGGIASQPVTFVLG